MAAIDRTPQVVTKERLLDVRLKTKIEKVPYLIVTRHRVTPENIVLENAGESPRATTIAGVTPSALPEVGGHIVELAPPDCFLASIQRINGNRALIRSVAHNVLTTPIYVHLETGEGADGRNHSW